MSDEATKEPNDLIASKKIFLQNNEGYKATDSQLFFVSSFDMAKKYNKC